MMRAAVFALLSESPEAGIVSSRIAEVVLLVEDARQRDLVRHYLRRAHNSSYRNIRVRPLPSGRGSGEQYVREKYPSEVKEYRTQMHRRRTALVVATDADLRPAAQRENELAAALETTGEQPRGETEAIVLLIPKRNVETWICCLTGERVDEVTDYKNRRGIDDMIRPAAGALYQWSRPRQVIPTDCVPSLQRAFPELRRLA